MATEVVPKVIVSRSLPQPQALDNVGREGSPIRGGRYSEQYTLNLWNTKHLLADEGSAFVTTNPTPGTAVTYALQTSFSDTAAFMVIKNNDIGTTAGKRIYLDALKLILTGTAPTGTVSMEFAFKLDNINRLPTANSSTLTPINVNMDASVGTIAQVFCPNAGAPTVPASSASARLVGRSHISTSLGITGDEYNLQFGATDIQSGIPGTTAARSTGVARINGDAPAIVIGPQQFCVIYMWWLTAATTAPSFEFQLTHFER